MADQATGGYSVEALANTILEHAEQCGIDVGPMKLQKLMYLVHGYYIAVTGRPLIDEYFEAWQYGPVAPTIYQAFKQFGSGTIKKGTRASCFSLKPGARDMSLDQPTIPKEDKTAAKMLRFVFNKYGDKSAIYLSDLTHKVGSPWEITKAKFPSMRSADIQNSLIEAYFKNFV